MTNSPEPKILGKQSLANSPTFPLVEGKVFITVQSKLGINNMVTALERRLQFIEEDNQTERWLWKKRERAHQCKIIELNVGGEIFTTTLNTLKKHPGSKLAEIFGQAKPQTDSVGRVFIDRPGTYFKYILEYLRGDCVPLQNVEEVYKEAVYYDLKPLIKQLEESPEIFGEMVARKQFVARVPDYSENIELMIRIARAEAVASRQSSVMLCVMKTLEDVARCSDALSILDTSKKSVVQFGPWKAAPNILDLLDCIKMDIEAKGYKTSFQSYVPEKGFRFKANEFFYRFLFHWW